MLTSRSRSCWSQNDSLTCRSDAEAGCPWVARFFLATSMGLSGGTQYTAGSVVVGGLLDDKEPFRIVGLMPNPTSDFAHLQFEVEVQQRWTVRLHAMLGEHLMDLFDGTAEAGVQYHLPIDVAGLSSGLYQLWISGAAYSAVRKLLVFERGYNSTKLS